MDVNTKLSILNATKHKKYDNRKVIFKKKKVYQHNIVDWSHARELGNVSSLGARRFSVGQQNRWAHPKQSLLRYQLSSLLPTKPMDPSLSPDENSGLDHVFLGFTRCGNYVVSYTEEFVLAPQPFVAYELSLWLVDLSEISTTSSKRENCRQKPKLKCVSTVSIFPNVQATSRLSIWACQWPLDSEFLIVHGSIADNDPLPHKTASYVDSDCDDVISEAGSESEKEGKITREFGEKDDEEKLAQQHCYVSILTIPNPAKFRANTTPRDGTTVSMDPENLELALHTTYLTVNPHPRFIPEISLKAKNWAIFNTGDGLIALTVSRQPIQKEQKQNTTTEGSPPSCSHSNLPYDAAVVSIHSQWADHEFTFDARGISLLTNGGRINRNRASSFGCGFLNLNATCRNLHLQSASPSTTVTSVLRSPKRGSGTTVGTTLYVGESHFNLESLLSDVCPFVCDREKCYEFIAIRDYDLQLLEVNEETTEVIAFVSILMETMRLYADTEIAQEATMDSCSSQDTVDNLPPKNYRVTQHAFAFCWNITKGLLKVDWELDRLIDCGGLSRNNKFIKRWNFSGVCRKMIEQSSVPVSHCQKPTTLSNAPALSDESMKYLMDPGLSMLIFL